MDRRYIDEQHIVARYLADRLSEAEREAFEAYYLQHPEIVSELEATAKFKAGLMRLQETGELGALLRAQPASARRWVWAAAAAVAALAVGVGFLLSNRGPERLALAPTLQSLTRAGGGALTVAGSYRLVRTRSSSLDLDISLPAAASAIELKVLPEFEARPPQYRIALAAVDGDTLRPVAAASDLRRAADGFVTVYLDSAMLAPGNYQLSVVGEQGTTAAAETSTFRIRLRHAGEQQ
jgi:hypothetical protein